MWSVFSFLLLFLKAGPGVLLLLQDNVNIHFIAVDIVILISFRQLYLLQSCATWTEFCFSHAMLSISCTAVIVESGVSLPFSSSFM